MGILSGIKKYKKYKQITETDHQLVSYWTSTDTVETNDGTDLTTFLNDVVLVDNNGNETDLPDVESRELDNDTLEFVNHDGNGEGLWSDFNLMTLMSGSKLSNLMEKITYTVNNVKYLINLLGSTDISQLSDGTVTGAISTINSNLETANSNLSSISNYTNLPYITMGTFASSNNYIACNFIFKSSAFGWYPILLCINTGLYYVNLSLVSRPNSLTQLTNYRIIVEDGTVAFYYIADSSGGTRLKVLCDKTIMNYWVMVLRGSKPNAISSISGAIS